VVPNRQKKRQSHPNESLERLYALFGVTRQAYYKAAAHENKTSIADILQPQAASRQSGLPHC
jgi:hypothetical protein